MLETGALFNRQVAIQQCRNQPGEFLIAIRLATHVQASKRSVRFTHSNNFCRMPPGRTNRMLTVFSHEPGLYTATADNFIGSVTNRIAILPPLVESTSTNRIGGTNYLTLRGAPG